MTVAPPKVSVVLPTYNRIAALRENFASVQALDGICEIVVVVDGSTDGTAEWLAGLADPRIKVIEQLQRGSPAARNAGVAAATGEFVLMTEDDCLLPPDFATTLLAVSRAKDADIVGAPWFQIADRDEIDALVEHGRRNAVATIGLRTNHNSFPVEDLETPFLNGVVLARRAVLQSIGYDESLGGNAWREETSLYLDATAAGARCVLTPRTAVFQMGQWGGGQRRSRLAYEAWAIRNNWRFLRRHDLALRRMGEIRHPLTSQARFIADRVIATVRGYLRARLRRLAAARGASSGDD